MHSSGIKNQVIHLGNVFKNVPFSAITENFFFFFELGSSLLLNTFA